jgi:hypothetical protein
MKNGMDGHGGALQATRDTASIDGGCERKHQLMKMLGGCALVFTLSRNYQHGVFFILTAASF